MTLAPTMSFRWLRRYISVTRDGIANIETEVVLQQKFVEVSDNWAIRLGEPLEEWIDVPTVTEP